MPTGQFSTNYLAGKKAKKAVREISENYSERKAMSESTPEKN